LTPESIEIVNGDLVFTTGLDNPYPQASATTEGRLFIKDLIVSDVTVRAQIRATDGGYVDGGVVVRDTYFEPGMTGSNLYADVDTKGSFGIGYNDQVAFGNFEQTFVSSTLDADMIVELNVHGNTATGYTWPAGTPKPDQPQSLLLELPPSTAPTGRVGIFNFGIQRLPITVRWVEVEPVIAGDFDFNGVLTVADIDGLAANVRAGTNTSLFDLNDDDKVQTEDRRIFIKDLRRTWFGDANLDGQFNSGDLVTVFQAGQYEDGVPGNSTWATGDFNGDAEFNTSDMVFAFQDGGYEKRPRAAAVPEPSCWVLFIAGMLWLVKNSRRISLNRSFGESDLEVETC
jgi:hypothetical protein